MRRASYVTASQLVKSLMLAVAFLLLARSLGAEEFGYFVSITAFFSIISPLIDFGLFNVNVKYLTDGLSERFVRDDSMRIIALGFSVAGILSIVVSLFIFDLPWLTVVLMGLQILLLEKTYIILRAYMIYREMFFHYSVLEVVQSGVKLVSVLLFQFAFSGINEWAVVSFVFTAVLAVFVQLVVYRLMKRDEGGRAGLFERLRFGWGFVASSFFETFTQEVDKILILMLLGPVQVGVYGVLMRVNNMALIPVGAYFTTVYKQYFELAKTSSYDSYRHGLKVAAVAGGFALVISATAFLLQDIIVILVGEQYQSIRDYIILSLFIPVVFAITQPYFDVLSSCDLQKHRVRIAFFSLIVNLILLPVFSSLWGLTGAVLSIVFSRLTIIVQFYFYSYKNIKIQ